MRDVSAANTVSLAWKKTCRRLKGSYMNWMAGMLVLILIRLAALSPLLALVLWEKGSPLRYLWVLSPMLYLFVILPLRYSMGEAMHDALNGSPFLSARLIDLKGYGRKLAAALQQAPHLLPWALPLLVGLGAGAYLMYGVENGAKVFRMVISLGRSLGEGYGLMEGAYIVAGFVGLLLLVLLYGMMRNGMVRFLFRKSGGRYALARKETLSRLKGRRGGQFLVAVIQTLLLLPVLVPGAYMGYRLFRDYLKTMKLDLSQLAEPYMLWGLVALFFLVYWPLLPLRKVLQAYYIRRAEDKQ